MTKREASLILGVRYIISVVHNVMLLVHFQCLCKSYIVSSHSLPRGLQVKNLRQFWFFLGSIKLFHLSLSILTAIFSSKRT